MKISQFGYTCYMFWLRIANAIFPRCPDGSYASHRHMSICLSSYVYTVPRGISFRITLAAIRFICCCWNGVVLPMACAHQDRNNFFGFDLRIGTIRITLCNATLYLTVSCMTFWWSKCWEIWATLTRYRYSTAARNGSGMCVRLRYELSCLTLYPNLLSYVLLLSVNLQQMARFISYLLRWVDNGGV